MDSPLLSILLISADDHFRNELADLLKESDPIVGVPFVLQTAVSPSETDNIESRPDLILLHTDIDSWITAVLGYFPDSSLAIILENVVNSVTEMLQLPQVVDVLAREELTAPLLKHLLSHFQQKQRLFYIEKKAREHRQISESLLQAGVKMNAILEYEPLMDSILLFASDFFPYDMASIMLVEGENVRIERIRTADENESLQWSMQKASRTIFSLADTRNLWTIVENGRYLVIPDVADYSGWVHVREDFIIRSWMGAPLIVQGQLMGILTLDNTRPNVYRDEDGKMLAAFATQAALALHNAHIHKRRQREIAELSALHEIAQASTEAITVDELLTRCTQIVAEKLYPDSFGFILVNDDGETMSAHHAVHNRLPVLHPEKLPIGTGVVGQVIETGVMRRVSDVRTDEEYEGIVAHTHSELCVPLRVGEEIIGAINAESILFEAFDEADERFMVALSQQLATGIERIQLLAAERKNREEADKLRNAAAFLSTSLELEQVFNNILSGLEKVVPHDSASVMLIHEDELVIAAAQGFSDSSELVGQSISIANSIFEEVQDTKRPLYLRDIQQDPRYIELKTDVNIRSWICLPLVVQEQVLGALTIDNEREGVYGFVEVQLAQAFANQAAIAIDNARLYAAEQQARTRAEILREASSMMVKSLDMDTILSILLDYLGKLVPYDTASVLFIDGDYAQIHLAKGIEAWSDIETMEQVRINVNTNGTFREIIRTRQGLVIPDVHQDDRWEIFEPSRYVRSWIGVPIIAAGELLGCFSIDKAVPGYFNQEHLELVEGFTSQAAVLIQNAQLFNESRQRMEELELLTTLSAALQKTTELEPMLQIILEKVLPLVNGNFGGIYIIEPETEELVMRCTFPYFPELIGARQSINKGISGYVGRTGSIYISPDFLNDPLLNISPSEVSVLSEFRTQTGVDLPLRTQEKIIGVLHVSQDYRHEYSDLEIQLLTAVSEIAGTAIDRAMVLDTLEQRVALRTHELANANERLTELDQLKTKFISDISHELRTPITNLSLYMDLFEQGRPERREQYMTVLRKQVDRLVSMIEDILNISRLDMGKIEIHANPVDMNLLIDQAVASLQVKLNEDVSLTSVLAENLPIILGDQQRLVQILEIILINSIDYTEVGSICVRSLWQKSQHRICVEVIDTGMGIPENELPHVFDRFYRASNVSQSTKLGTGLGLPLAKELMHLHQGSIEISSELDKGTTVYLFFPVAPQVLALS